MLTAICGGICAGKHEVAKYLIQHHGFLEVHLSNTATTSATEGSAPGTQSPCLDQSTVSGDEKGKYSFAAIDLLLDFVTKRWQERWVMTEIWNESVLERLVRRPFFLLVSINAPANQH
ncbi:Deoxycytidine monophosphate (dCMP) deaminase [Xylographa pallens]|nr:Deoxycytidine monophosphate (dCMP) deaminase [Xylographa pallens]